MSTHKRSLIALGITFFEVFAMLSPLMTAVAFPPLVRAATPGVYGNDECYSYFTNTEDVADNVSEISLNEGAVIDDNGFIALDSIVIPEAVETVKLVEVLNLTELATKESTSEIARASLSDDGYAATATVSLAKQGLNLFYTTLTEDTAGYSKGTRIVGYCENPYEETDPYLVDLFRDAFDTTLPLSPINEDVVSMLLNNSPRIAFKNPIDRYYLLGEPCASGLIDVPRSQWSDTTNPCPGFRDEDDYIPNGKWDAPKVDIKVLRTLEYLVTPIEDGGAGREYIRIKQLVVNSVTGNVFDTPVIEATATPTAGNDTYDTINQEIAALTGESGDSLASALDATATTTSSASEEAETATLPSAYLINPDDLPHLPQTLSRAVMIDQVDKLRVTTKITQNRLFGNDTTTYETQAPIPINLSWQSDEGMSGDEPPDITNYTLLKGSRVLVNASIVQLLNSLNLGDLEIDTTEAEINTLTDVAELVGLSLVEQLLGTPRGSMKGYDLLSTLQSIGLSYLEQNLGLVPGSLADANPLDGKGNDALDTNYDGVVETIGRRTTEYILGLPTGSLSSSSGSSAEVLESMGRTYLEKEVFQVSSGTLTPSDGYPLATVGDLLARLGEGRIEKVFKLPAQSLRKKTYTSTIAANSFRESSFKASLLFPKPKSAADYTEDDFLLSDWVSGQLALEYNGYVQVDDAGNRTTFNTTMYGFSQDDFKFPTLNIDGDNEDSLSKFKQLVGSRVVETSLGVFKREGAESSDLTAEISPLVPPTSFGDSWTATINGTPLNPQFVPYTTDGNNYCTESRTTYAQAWTGGGGTDAREFSGDLNTEKVKEIIQFLKERTSTLSGNYVGPTVSCAPDPVASESQTFTGLTRQVLFENEPLYRYVFLNTSKAPKLDEFNTEDDPKGQGGTARDKRFNTALLLYYNLPENHQKVSINEIPLDSEAATALEGTESTSDITSLTVSKVLGVLFAGGSFTNIGYNWLANPELGARLSMLLELQKKDTEAGTFNLSSILTDDMADAARDAALVDRINKLTIKPASGASFASQYTDPAYNGWLYLLQDIREHLSCAVTGGRYVFNADKTGMQCSQLVYLGQDPENQSGPSVQDVAILKETIKLIDRLYSEPWSVTQTLVKTLNTLTLGDSTITGSGLSAMTQAVGLSVSGRTFDSNRRISSLPTCAGVGEGCYNGRDLIRALVAPNARGTVSLSTSIASYFVQGNQKRTPIQSVGRQYAARVFSNDAIAQSSFASMLESDFSDAIAAVANTSNALAELDQVIKNRTTQADTLGIDVSSIEEQGMLDGDFARIFSLDQSKQVFSRIGKDQLLRLVWERTGATSKIKNRAEYQQFMKAANQVSRTATNASDTIVFYRTRLDILTQKVDQLSILLNDTTKDLNTALRTVRSSDISNALRGDSERRQIANRYEAVIGALKTKYLVAEEGGDSRATEIITLVQGIEHLLQEIRVGRKLPVSSRSNPYSESAESYNNSQKKGNEREQQGDCVAKSVVISIFNPGNIIEKLTSYAKEAGSCQVERQLGLPSGSLLTWYDLGSQAFFPKAPDMTAELERAWDELQSSLLVSTNPETGLPTEDVSTVQTERYERYTALLDESNAAQERYKQTLASYFTIEPGAGGVLPVAIKSKVGTWKRGEWNITNFYIALGITKARQRNTSSLRNVSNDQLSEWLFYQGPNAVLELQKSGKALAEATILRQLSNLVGGLLGSAVTTYRLTSEDLVAMLQGSMRPLFEKVGGTILDKALNLGSGTAAALMYPVCTNSTGDEVACNNDPNNPDSNAANVRARIIASEGLRKLGLQIGTDVIPAGFDFFGGDNLAAAWGNAIIARNLSLATSSFRGSITASPAQAGTKACKNEALRCLNDSDTLARAFGFARNPLRSAISSINRKALTALSRPVRSQAGVTPDEYTIADTIRSSSLRITTETESAIYDITLANAADSASAYWQVGTDQEATSTEALADRDWKRFIAYTGSVWTTIESAPITDAAKRDVRQTIIRSVTAPLGSELAESLTRSLIDTTDWQAVVSALSFISYGNTTLTSLYKDSLIPSFREMLKQLNSRYTKAGSESGRFEAFMRGEIPAENISTEATELNLVDGTVANLINSRINDGPTWLKNLSEGLKLVSSEQCGRDYSVGELLTNAVRQNVDCLGSLGSFSTADLIYGSSENMEKLRGMLFDNYLAGFFSAELEQSIGIRVGTFKRIAINPTSARQIVAQEGVLMVSDNVFGKTTKYDPCANQSIPGGSCVQGQLTNAVREAFLAGFCSNWKDIRKTNTTAGCGFTFNSSRSKAAFTAKANEAIDTQLGRIGAQYLGVAISRASLSGVENGDMRPLAVIAIQAVVKQLNDRLYNGSKRSPLGRFNAVFTQDLRAAFGLDEASPYQNAYDSAYAGAVTNQLATEFSFQENADPRFQTAYLRGIDTETFSVKLSLPSDGVTPVADSYGLLNSQSLNKAYADKTKQNRELLIGRPVTSEEHAELDRIADSQRRAEAVSSANQAMKSRRVAARNKLQYAFYDALLASKLSYLPPRFSERLLSASSADRSRALAEFAFGSVLNGNSPFGTYLRRICSNQSEVDCYALFDELAVSIKRGGQSMEAFYATNSRFISLIDRNLNSWFEESTGFGLPAGTISGVYVWGMRGFKSEDFNKEGFCLGTTDASGNCRGTYAVPVGRILQTFGEEKLFAWSDTTLGVKPGTTAKLVRIATLSIDLAKDLQQLNSFVNTERYNTFIAIGTGQIGVDDAVAYLDELDSYEAAAKQRITDKRAVAIAQLASEVVVSLFSSQFASFDDSVGLPSGTTAIVIGAVVTYGVSMALGATGSAATAAAFGPAFFIALGFSLVFGVTGVEIEVQATADGYYPFYSSYNRLGSGSASDCQGSGLFGGCSGNGTYYEQLSADSEIGQFDASRTQSYRQGLKRAAQAKVRSLLLNLLAMPESSWATNSTYDFMETWPSQVFTYGGNGAEYNVLENRVIAGYINRNTPFHPTAPDIGYGGVEERCSSVTAGPNPFSISCIRRQSWRIGYYGLPNLLDAVHIRF
jgi:hypothetical protein